MHLAPVRHIELYLKRCIYVNGNKKKSGAERKVTEQIIMQIA